MSFWRNGDRTATRAGSCLFSLPSILKNLHDVTKGRPLISLDIFWEKESSILLHLGSKFSVSHSLVSLSPFSPSDLTISSFSSSSSRAAKDLIELSTLGHFLKGSSAAVGVIKVRDSCECMQHYGKSRDEDGVSELTEEEALTKLTSTLSEVKVQYKEAEKALRKYYAGDEDEEGEEEEEEKKD